MSRKQKNFLVKGKILISITDGERYHSGRYAFLLISVSPVKKSQGFAKLFFFYTIYVMPNDDNGLYERQQDELVMSSENESQGGNSIHVDADS